MEKIFFLNAFPLNSLYFSKFKFPGYSPIKTLFIKINPISVKEVKEIIKDRKIVSFIGHEGTASLLSSLLETKISFNRGMARLKAGDEAIVVTLKKRQKIGGDKKDIEKKDLKFFHINIPTDQWGYFNL